MELKVLHIDASSGFYKVERFPAGRFLGPVDLGFHLSDQRNALSFGVGLFAGSVIPGTNRLVFTGLSPCWGGFFVSSMGGAGLAFDNLGISMASVSGRAARPSVLALNREHGEEISVSLHPVDLAEIWRGFGGERGVYGLIRYTHSRFAGDYKENPRILATGPAAAATDIGAIGSMVISSAGEFTHVDTWAGRGGFGSKLLQDHGIAAVIYGGTFIDEDFRDRKLADSFFERHYHKKMQIKDLEATKKYRFDPEFDTGGTFGVNYARVGGRIMAFNYRSVMWDEERRRGLHTGMVTAHYLRQFNEETIRTKSSHTCGEPCAAVCKKLRGKYKKDYEPYQVMGPLSGIFDQRAAELLNHEADAAGFDAISLGGVISWLLDCVASGMLRPEDLGLEGKPVFGEDGFRVVEDSAANAEAGRKLIEGILGGNPLLDLRRGARDLARRLQAEKGCAARDLLVVNSFRRRGWMVPNQYWCPGALAPMPVMGKYYMHYGFEFWPPRELGRLCAGRMVKELVMDNFGVCRFHRQWAEELLPELVSDILGVKGDAAEHHRRLASRMASRNCGIFWEGEREMDFVKGYLERCAAEDAEKSPELMRWLDAFRRDKRAAACDYWFEMLKGIQESLREFGPLK